MERTGQTTGHVRDSRNTKRPVFWPKNMTNKPVTTSTPGEGMVQNECTLLSDARETLADIEARRAGTTHYEGCRRDHTGCLIGQLIREVERLREAIRRLAEQDATLSVQGGAVTVTMDATLTPEERLAIENACKLGTFPDEVAVLRRLLARTGHNNGHVPCSRNWNDRPETYQK